MRVTVAYDEGPAIGLGHRRRCEAIARELPAGWTISSGPLTAGAQPVVADLAIVDSYLFRADDPAVVRAQWVVALDDLARDLAVDCVVDPSPGADPSRHRAATLVLAGAPYSIVTPGTTTIEPDPMLVLVTTGAADHAGVGAQLAAAIAMEVPAARVRLVLGPWGSRLVPSGTEACEAPDGLHDELAAATVVVTAGGVTMLEALAMGRAVVAVETADNQHANVESVRVAGAAVVVDRSEIPEAVARLLRDPRAREQLAERGRALIDGQGARRIAAAIVADVITKERV